MDLEPRVLDESLDDPLLPSMRYGGGALPGWPVAAPPELGDGCPVILPDMPLPPACAPVPACPAAPPAPPAPACACTTAAVPHIRPASKIDRVVFLKADVRFMMAP